MINDKDECVCASECPATENAALADANEIRASAKSHANEQLSKFDKGRTMKVQYEYSGAFAADDGEFRHRVCVWVPWLCLVSLEVVGSYLVSTIPKLLASS